MNIFYEYLRTYQLKRTIIIIQTVVFNVLCDTTGFSIRQYTMEANQRMLRANDPKLMHLNLIIRFGLMYNNDT